MMTGSFGGRWGTDWVIFLKFYFLGLFFFSLFTGLFKNNLNYRYTGWDWKMTVLLELLLFSFESNVGTVSKTVVSLYIVIECCYLTYIKAFISMQLLAKHLTLLISRKLSSLRRSWVVYFPCGETCLRSLLLFVCKYALTWRYMYWCVVFL